MVSHSLSAKLTDAYRKPGVKSVARKSVLGGTDDPPQRTGFAAYRATVEAVKIKDDPEISWLLEKPALNIWIGEDRHVMTYSIAAGESFNMVLSHVDTSDSSTWKPENAVKDMQGYFKGWDPRLTKIIAMIEKTIKWPLLSGKQLQRWVAPSNKVLIMGDAAHAMVPYMSQGAAIAVEDGAALAAVLSLVETAEDISAALKVFETVRIKRSGQMQAASLLNGKLWHFADGPEQVLRDEAMRPEVEGRNFSWSPNQWSDPVTQWWAYGYDAEREVEEEWERMSLATSADVETYAMQKNFAYST
jgi:salicylate hydroxylase